MKVELKQVATFTKIVYLNHPVVVVSATVITLSKSNILKFTRRIMNIRLIKSRVQLGSPMYLYSFGGKIPVILFNWF